MVEDVDEALECDTGSLGFDVRMDDAFETESVAGRRVSVSVPRPELQLALVTANDPVYDDEAGETLAAKQVTETYYTLRTFDREASVTALEAADIEITREIQEYPWGGEAKFADSSGSEFVVFEYAGE